MFRAAQARELSFFVAARACSRQVVIVYFYLLALTERAAVGHMNSLGAWSSNKVLIDILTVIFEVTLFVLALTAAVVIVTSLLWWLTRFLPRGPRERIGRLSRHLYFNMFGGAWRRAVLGVAAVVLTAASAYTTWGGLLSFTEHDVEKNSTTIGLLLAFAIAAGIQAVMLLAAWFIGDFFADGMAARFGAANARRRAVELWIGTALGLALVFVASWWIVTGGGANSLEAAAEFWRRFLTVAAMFGSGALVLGFIYCFRGNEFVRPYVQGFGVVAKSAIVWIMFLASLAASVFFSFDYHFRAIFSPELRKETANSRAQQKMPSVTNYLGKQMPERERAERAALFNQSAWTSYQVQLDLARKIGERSPELQRERDKGIADIRSQRVADLKKNLADLMVDVEPLASGKAVRDLRLESLATQQEEARKKHDAQTARVNSLKQSVAAAEAEANREAGGVPGGTRSGKEGRKTKWAAAMKTVRQRKADLAAAEQELVPIAEQLRALNAEADTLVANRATSDPRLAVLASRAEAAKKALEREADDAAADGERADPVVARRKLDAVVELFRQAPSAPGLNEIQVSCVELKTIGQKAGDPDAGILDCDPKQVNEGLTGFLNEKKRIDKVIADCTQGRNISGLDVGQMVTFARTCLQDSGLPNAQLADHYKVVREISDMRDDKAQSFIVTLTAFSEGNDLAYLALAVALTVNSLIFFSGVFAATTMTGPLQRAGLRDIAARVQQLPAKDVRWALAALRDHRYFELDQTRDPRIGRIVRLGLDCEIPAAPPGTCLVAKREDGDPVRYELHKTYLDELEDVVQRAARRGDLAPESAETAAAPSAGNAPGSSSGGAGGQVLFLPRRSARSA